jgi:hypothetical protein
MNELRTEGDDREKQRTVICARYFTYLPHTSPSVQIGATSGPGSRSKLRTKSHCLPVSGLCGNRRYFSTDFHSSAMKLSAAAPSSTVPDSTSQQPTTTPVRPIPPRQCTAAMRPRRALSPRTSRIWRTYDSERGRHRSGIGKEWYSTSPSSMLPKRATCAARCGAYGESSPLSVRSMNVRTPARSNRSSFCERCARVGVHGYSHATSSGVAQYELGNGLGFIGCFPLESVAEVGSWLPECMG